MEVLAKSRYIRQSPRKLRMIAQLLHGKDVKESLQILKSVSKRGTGVLEKVINSALSNAKLKSDKDDWRIKRVVIDGGPMLKRFRATTMGRAVIVKKRTSHITVVLEEFERRQ